VGLGRDFAGEVSRCLDRIAEHPTLYARVKKEYRRANVRRCPFAIYYEHTANIITVYSVFHCAQDPQKIDDRLQ